MAGKKPPKKPKRSGLSVRFPKPTPLAERRPYDDEPDTAYETPKGTEDRLFLEGLDLLASSTSQAQEDALDLAEKIESTTQPNSKLCSAFRDRKNSFYGAVQNQINYLQRTHEKGVGLQARKDQPADLTQRGMKALKDFEEKIQPAQQKCISFNPDGA